MLDLMYNIYPEHKIMPELTFMIALLPGLHIKYQAKSKGTWTGLGIPKLLSFPPQTGCSWTITNIC